MQKDCKEKNVKGKILTTSRQSTILANFSSGSPRRRDTLGKNTCTHSLHVDTDDKHWDIKFANISSNI